MKKIVLVLVLLALAALICAQNEYRTAPHNLSGVTAAAGQRLTYLITGGSSGSVWGSNDNAPFYTDDSGLAAAAVHSGMIVEDEKALVTFEVVAGGDRYSSVERNGIGSQDYGVWRRGYKVVEAQSLMPPLRQASQVRLSLAGEGGTISWLRGDGDAVIVFMKQASTGAAYPIQQTSYEANSVFGYGNSINDTGWFCVYKGTGTGVSISNLSSGLAYVVSVMEYNYPVEGYETYNTRPHDLDEALPMLTNQRNRIQAFNFTGSHQYFTVPAGVEQIKIKVWGAGGAGRTGQYDNASGGSGGYAEGYLVVSPGERLVVVVGGGGGFGTENGGVGGWPGGGYGTKGDASGGGGGGLTGVFLGTVSQQNALIIAGSGGGGGYQIGGAGGGYDGNVGGGQGGNPGTQAAGGTGTAGGDGAALQGGNGSGERLGGSSDGGGGGAGYFGGEGGFDDARSGGGGSGYIRRNGSMSSSLIPGTDGAATDVLPPKTDDPQYVQGCGVGRKGEFNGGNGLFIFEW